MFIFKSTSCSLILTSSSYHCFYLYRTQQQILKDQKRETFETLKSSTPPSSPASPSIHHAPVMSPLPRNKVSVESVISPASQYSNVENHLRSNPGLSIINSNIDSCKGNPSAAAALVMMNAILTSQHQQQQVHLKCF